MEEEDEMVHVVHELVWGPGLLLAFLGVGIYYTAAFRFFQIRKIKYWMRETAGSIVGKNKEYGESRRIESRTEGGTGESRHGVSQFQSACTALAATIGTGNIVGVATALTAGGAGAIFWMWISAVIGMMTAYAETYLGIRYRQRKRDGSWICGPMVYLEKGMNPARKTPYDLIAVEKGKRLINMDSQAPNKVFGEWVADGGFLPDVRAVRGEYRYGDSRLDFCLETPGGLHLVEVKGVTLEEDGAAWFPDAPTERGIKHIQELQKAVEAGLDATLFFVVQMEAVRSVAPNDATHPAFGEALRKAAAAGVRVRAYDCTVTPDSLAIRQPVPVIL